MKVFTLVCICLLLITVISGCKKDDEVTTPPALAAGTMNEVEPNDQTAQALGALGTTDVTVVGSSSTANDVDQYTVVLGAATNLHADITWAGGGDLGVGIMSSAAMLTFRNTGASPRGCTITALPAGTYTIYVNANGATGFPQGYSLKIGPR